MDAASFFASTTEPAFSDRREPIQLYLSDQLDLPQP